MPFFGTRRFDMHTKRTFMNDGSNRRGSNEELVVGEMGQVGTQFDGFAHQTHDDSLYNCVKLDDIATRNGFHQARNREGRLAHHARRADRRGGAQRRRDAAGHLRDHARGSAAGARAPEADAAARRRRAHSHRLGQAVGQGQRALREELSGLGIAAAEWLAKQDPMLVGADNWPVEVAPNPDPNSHCRSIRSCSSSTASTCSRT